MISDSTRRLLVASKVKGVGRGRLLALIKDPLFFRTPLEEFHSCLNGFSGFAPNTEVFDKALAEADYDIEQSKTNGDRIYSPLDPDYPRLLKNCADAPALLFVRGNEFNFSEKSVAIIGTREPTAKGSEVCKRISKYFSDNGWHIASGLALGVDTLAHSACVESGGIAVAALAHGLNYMAPKSSSGLANAIVRTGGALVSEYSYRTPPFSGHFVERDRIQAGLSRGVIVIQTDIVGGSLHAVRASMRYGRFVFAPRPLEPDISNQESKIRGINKMLYDAPYERAAFLKCNISMLSRCLEIGDKDDLIGIEGMMGEFVG